MLLLCPWAAVFFSENILVSLLTQQLFIYLKKKHTHTHTHRPLLIFCPVCSTHFDIWFQKNIKCISHQPRTTAAVMDFYEYALFMIPRFEHDLAFRKIQHTKLSSTFDTNLAHEKVSVMKLLGQSISHPFIIFYTTYSFEPSPADLGQGGWLHPGRVSSQSQSRWRKNNHWHSHPHRRTRVSN